jgi:hypothetical protein
MYGKLMSMGLQKLYDEVELASKHGVWLWVFLEIRFLLVGVRFF